MINTHTELLNALIEKYKLKSYLEIGVQNPANNFDRINVDYKVGIDPEINNEVSISRALFKISSDIFFSEIVDEESPYSDIEAKFDLIFIDGLHHADQVKRDFENSLRCLNDGGFIVLHDCLPINESTTHVPRDSKVWHGDCYKFAMTLCEYDGIDFKSCEQGGRCLWVWKDATKNGFTHNHPLTFETYLKYGKELLRLKDTVEI